MVVVDGRTDNFGSCIPPHPVASGPFCRRFGIRPGYSRTVRTADAIAFSLWPSRGLYATGYEIKVSNAGLNKEFKEPEKAEEIARFCRMWFVVTPLGLCKPEGLPSAWGLVEVKPDMKLKWTNPCVPNMEAQEPTWQFVCSIMRNMEDSCVPRADFERRLASGIADAEKRHKDMDGWELKQAREALTDLRERVADFEKRAGFTLDKYSHHFNGEIGEAVKLLRHYRESPLERIVALKGAAERIASDIDVIVRAVNCVK